MTRYFRWIGVLSLLVICAVGPGLCADELVAPGVDTVTSFTGATVADYDLKVTLATQTIVVTGGSSGPGEAQVIPSLGAVSGPGDEKIGFVSHKGGSASYLVWGGYGGGSGSGSPSRWTNQYTTGSASTAYFSIYIGDRNTTDDDYFTLDSSSTVTVELHNAQPNQTYKVVLTQSSEDGGAVIGLPSSDQAISEGSPVVLSVTGSYPGNVTIFAVNATTSTAPAGPGATSQADVGMGGYVTPNLKIVRHGTAWYEPDMEGEMSGEKTIGEDKGTKTKFTSDQNSSTPFDITVTWKKSDNTTHDVHYTITPKLTDGVPVDVKRIKVKVTVTNVRMSCSDGETGTISQNSVTSDTDGGDQQANTEVGKQTYTVKDYKFTGTKAGLTTEMKCDVKVEIKAYN